MSLPLSHAAFPYASTLRVYEPLHVFDDALQQAIRAQGHLSHEEIEQRERNAAAARNLRPTEVDPFPHNTAEIFRTVQVSSETEGVSTYYNPSQLTLRSTLAAQEFAEHVSSPLARLLIPEESQQAHTIRVRHGGQSPESAADGARAHNDGELPRPGAPAAERGPEADQGSTGHLGDPYFESPVWHTARSVAGVDAESPLSFNAEATFGPPIPWFVAFSTDDMYEVVESHTRVETVRILTTVTQARERIKHAIAAIAIKAPDMEVLDQLTPLATWLTHFSATAMLELDYGLVADLVFPDESPFDVLMGIECISQGDLTGAAAAYHRLMSRWFPVKQLARAS